MLCVVTGRDACAPVNINDVQHWMSEIPDAWMGGNDTEAGPVFRLNRLFTFGLPSENRLLNRRLREISMASSIYGIRE